MQENVELTDSDGENGETESSLDFAKDYGYCSQNEHSEWIRLNHEIGKMLGIMINNPQSFLIQH
jgi:four helix bundle protein